MTNTYAPLNEQILKRTANSWTQITVQAVGFIARRRADRVVVKILTDQNSKDQNINFWYYTENREWVKTCGLKKKS